MSEPAPHPIEVPELPPERLAEIHAIVERVDRGDFSGLLSWEEVAEQLGLPAL